MNVRIGCHARLLIFSATNTWELVGELSWSGWYVVEPPSETFVFESSNNGFALAGGKTASGYGGIIFLNESTQPGKIISVMQGETWFTEEVGS